MVRGRNKVNGIHKLEDANEKIITDTKDREQEILRFYNALIGTPTAKLKHVDIEVLRNGNQLKDISTMELIKPISEEEVKEVINSIRDNKSPGHDGYNSRFFKSAW